MSFVISKSLSLTSTSSEIGCCSATTGSSNVSVTGTARPASDPGTGSGRAEESNSTKGTEAVVASPSSLSSAGASKSLLFFFFFLSFRFCFLEVPELVSSATALDSSSIMGISAAFCSCTVPSCWLISLAKPG